MKTLNNKEYRSVWQMLHKAYRHGGQGVIIDSLLEQGFSPGSVFQINASVFNSFTKKEQIDIVKSNNLVIYPFLVGYLIRKQEYDLVLAIFQRDYDFHKYIWTILSGPMGKNMAFIKKFLKIKNVADNITPRQLDVYWGQLTEKQRRALTPVMARLKVSDHLFLEIIKPSVENLNFYLENQVISNSQVDLLDKEQLYTIGTKLGYSFFYQNSSYLILKLIECNLKLVSPNLLESLPPEDVKDLVLLLKIYKIIRTSKKFDASQVKYYGGRFKKAIMNTPDVKKILKDNHLNFLKLHEDKALDVVEKLMAQRKSQLGRSVEF